MHIKRFTLVILAAVIFVSAYGFGCGNAEVFAEDTPIRLGYSVSENILGAGEKAEVTVFMENFAEASFDCSGLQLNIDVDPDIFSVGAVEYLMSNADTLAATSNYSKVKNQIITLYFNIGSSYLPRDTKNIVKFELELLQTYSVEKSIALTIDEFIVTNRENVNYPVEKTPILILCGDPIQYRTSVSLSPAAAGSVKCNGVAIENGSSVLNTAGARATLSAAAADGYEFLYWKEETLNKVVSISADYTFIISSDSSFVAVFEKNARGEELAPGSTSAPEPFPQEQEYLVIFIDTGGSILSEQYISTGGRASIPEQPFRFGYDFTGWTVSAGELDNVQCNIIASPTYAKSSEKYTVTVNGGLLVPYGGSEGSFLYDECVVIELDEKQIPDAEIFIGWSKEGEDGRIISYSGTYSFLATGDATVHAVYGAAGTEIKAKPVVYMNEPSKLDEGRRISFISERSVPDGYKYLSSGILFTEDETVGASSAFLPGAEKVMERKTKYNAINAQFNIIKKSSGNSPVYARAYLMYMNLLGEIEIIYSNTVVVI